jgi:hypothetical protein
VKHDGHPLEPAPTDRVILPEKFDRVIGIEAAGEDDCQMQVEQGAGRSEA